jgi:hypothetical protein
VAVVDVVKTLRAIRYDGTNSADVLANIGTASSWDGMRSIAPQIHSESGGVLVIRYPGMGNVSESWDFPINQGDWIILSQPTGEQFVINNNVVPLSELTNP